MKTTAQASSVTHLQTGVRFTINVDSNELIIRPTRTRDLMDLLQQVQNSLASIATSAPKEIGE